jgi:hypothetical protein
MIVSSVWWDGVLGSPEHLGRRVLSHRSVHGRDGEGRIRSQRRIGRSAGILQVFSWERKRQGACVESPKASTEGWKWMAVPRYTEFRATLIEHFS